MLQTFLPRALAFTVAAGAALSTTHVIDTPPRPVAAVEARSGVASELGRDVFKSLFFLQGGSRTAAILKDVEVSSFTDAEIADVLASVNTPEAVARVRQIERELDARNPQYFSELGRTVASGDPALIRSALDASCTQMLSTPTMRDATAALRAEQSYVPGEIGTDCGVAVVVALGVAIAVTAVAAINYALAVNIALGYNVAAGTNKVVQRSAPHGGDTDRFSAGVVAAVVGEFSR